MKNVILQTGEDRRATVRKAVEELGEDFITKCRASEYIFIKVNLIDHERQLACTHVDAVRGVLDVIRTYCKTPVKIGDASHSGTMAGFDNFGYERLLDEYNKVELIDLNDDDFVDGHTVRKDGSENPIRRSKTAVEAQMKICIAPLKVHDDVLLDACVYSWTTGTWIVPSRISVVGRVWARWPWLQEEGQIAHSQSIIELYKQSKCDVAIVDGIIAMEGNGPVEGSMVEMGVVVAGYDPVAVDAVCATLIGLEPLEIGYLQMIAREELGEIDLSKINVPPMLITELAKQFRLPQNFEN
ncbi:MAG: DUF362 domain-containing protein [Patescibacteria group bacterium]